MAAARTVYKVTDVFVPGGLPRYTYVPRTDRMLEEQITSTKENLCKIATVTGATKSGKTVLVRTVFRNDQPIWIDGGAVASMDDFIASIADLLEVETASEFTSEQNEFAEVGGEMGGEAGIPLLAKGKAKLSGKTATGSSMSKTTAVARSVKTRVIQTLKTTHRPLVIDDFHYLTRELQGQITRLLKPLVFEGVPVVYLAIPHRRYDAVKVEREMNGRIQQVQVPAWEYRELAQIAQKGFPLLNVRPDLGTSSRLANETHGSPHLMQEFCRKICARSGFTETPAEPREINPKFSYESIFTEVAGELGKVVFDKLARGPRARADRLQRPLKSGQTADIYKVTLLALANLHPTVQTINYEILRNSMRDILASDLPQANEITRVLEQMSKISSQDESSVAVVDYDKEYGRLHVTDPFFAFFLRWGGALISA